MQVPYSRRWVIVSAFPSVARFVNAGMTTVSNWENDGRKGKDPIEKGIGKDFQSKH